MALEKSQEKIFHVTDVQNLICRFWSTVLCVPCSVILLQLGTCLLLYRWLGHIKLESNNFNTERRFRIYICIKLHLQTRINHNYSMTKKIIKHFNGMSQKIFRLDTLSSQFLGKCVHVYITFGGVLGIRLGCIQSGLQAFQVSLSYARLKYRVKAIPSYLFFFVFLKLFCLSAGGKKHTVGTQKNILLFLCSNM